jgi:hypothetical protein
MRNCLHCRYTGNFTFLRVFPRWLVQSILSGQVHVKSERPLGLCTVAATQNNVSNFFPNTSSESDLQRYRAVWDRSSRERKSPSLSNVASDSLRHKVRRANHVSRLWLLALQQWKVLVMHPRSPLRPQGRPASIFQWIQNYGIISEREKLLLLVRRKHCLMSVKLKLCPAWVNTRVWIF